MQLYQKPSNDLAVLAFSQLITPPFRAETGIPSSELPVYAALNPTVPPLLSNRAVSILPNISNQRQWQQLLIQANLIFWY